MTETDLAIIVAASLLGAFVKSIAGMGYPLVAIPLITLTVDIETAVVVLAIPNLFANAWLSWGAREARGEVRNVASLVAGAAVGAVAGTAALVRVDADILVGALAAVIVVYLVFSVAGPQWHVSSATSGRWSPVVGGAAGVMQGSVGVSGPIVAMWFHGHDLAKSAYVYAVTSVFLVAGLAQLAVLVTTDAFDADRLTGAALATAAALFVIPLGTRVRHRLSVQRFRQVVLVLLAVAAISLALRVLI